MSLISVHTYEHLAEENTVVSYKIIRFLGIPLYSWCMESSNYNYVGQFNSANFTTNNEEVPASSLYKTTNIGYKNEETTTKETKKTEVQSGRLAR